MLLYAARHTSVSSTCRRLEHSLESSSPTQIQSPESLSVSSVIAAWTYQYGKGTDSCHKRIEVR